MAADAIITDSGAMHVAGVPIVNPSTVVVWEVTPGPGNGFQTTPKTSTSNGVPPSINPPSWAGFSPLAAYLFSWQEYLISEAKNGKKLTDPDFSDTVQLHCSPVSNFSAYVSPEAAAQSATTTTWGSGVTAVAFDPTRGGSVIAVVIVEGMNLYSFSKQSFRFDQMINYFPQIQIHILAAVISLYVDCCMFFWFMLFNCNVEELVRVVLTSML